jgi:hypothetical protein
LHYLSVVLIILPFIFEDFIPAYSTYLSAIVSFAMVFIAFYTLIQTKEQAEEDNRSYVFVNISEYFHVTDKMPNVKKNICEYVLVFENTRNTGANCISIKFNS